MENTQDYQKLAESLCDIHFLYSKDLSNVFEQHSTRGEEAALFWLSRLESPVSAGELAGRLGITSGRIANILSSLDRKKFIERHRSSKDRRQINVVLTDAGAAHIQKVYDSARESHIVLLSRMGSEDAEDFIRLMNKAIRTAAEITGA
ncbi:MAG: MarR family winged helix-turn-helix transcriptional regulator [Eubacteriales bacterium]|nr:MarR family winged helix-turn-helix transcriptional regulator [Eubacteriales bacterium]